MPKTKEYTSVLQDGDDDGSGAYTLTIHIPHSRTIEDTLEYVTNLIIKDGCTSGYYPTWDLSDDPEGLTMENVGALEPLPLPEIPLQLKPIRLMSAPLQKYAFSPHIIQAEPAANVTHSSGFFVYQEKENKPLR